MKSITKNVLLYAIVALLLTITFRYCLSSVLEAKEYTLISLIAIAYGISMFASGWYFGNKDRKDLELHDIGFRFHLVTYIIFNAISEIWFLLGFNSTNEQVYGTQLTAFIWGIFLFIHWVFYLKTRKNTIDGLDKSELFQ
jgi:membrane protease YdiL (CAAX protease family)